MVILLLRRLREEMCWKYIGLAAPLMLSNLTDYGHLSHSARNSSVQWHVHSCRPIIDQFLFTRCLTNLRQEAHSSDDIFRSVAVPHKQGGLSHKDRLP
jgi:hypothetical protein